MEDEIESLKKKCKTLQSVIDNLEETADKLSSEAEKYAHSRDKMAEKLAQANALRSKRKEKKGELADE